jgi:hypothetical protein
VADVGDVGEVGSGIPERIYWVNYFREILEFWSLSNFDQILSRASGVIFGRSCCSMRVS